MFRTADAAGMAKLYLAGITPAPIDAFGAFRKEIAKVALGSERTMQWEKARSAPELFRRLRAEGFRIVILEQSAQSIPYGALRVRDASRIALVVGSETKGVPSALLRLADDVIAIPMLGRKESLNVSVAFGIAAYGILHACAASGAKSGRSRKKSGKEKMRRR